MQMLISVWNSKLYGKYSLYFIACGYYLDEKRIAQLNQYLDEKKVPKIDERVLVQVLTHLKELELMHE